MLLLMPSASASVGGWTWDSTVVTLDSLFATLDGATPWGSTGHGLTIDTITSTGAVAHWNAAVVPTVAGYVLSIQPPSGSPIVVDAGNVTSYPIGALAASTSYVVSIAAYDAGHVDTSIFDPTTTSFSTLASSGGGGGGPTTGVRMQPQYAFGPGIGWITPLTDSSGAAITNPAPALIAAMQDISIDMSSDVKELYGQGSFALAIGRGKQKFGVKIKNGQMNGALWNQMYWGQSLVSSVYSAYYDTTGTTLASTTVTPTIPGSGTFGYDLGVRDVNNIPLQRVASAPTTGQYSMTAGVYTFSSADVSASKVVYISFNYTGTSTVAKSLLLNNVPMGYAPTFQFDMIVPYQGNTLAITLFNCMGSKMSFATKLDDFAYPEFDFSGFAPGASAIGKMAWSQ